MIYEKKYSIRLLRNIVGSLGCTLSIGTSGYKDSFKNHYQSTHSCDEALFSPKVEIALNTLDTVNVALLVFSINIFMRHYANNIQFSICKNEVSLNGAHSYLMPEALSKYCYCPRHCQSTAIAQGIVKALLLSRHCRSTANLNSRQSLWDRPIWNILQLFYRRRPIQPKFEFRIGSTETEISHRNFFL